VSISWRLDADPRPAILVAPRAAASLDEAHAAIDLWEFYKGRTLDPTQRLVVEIMMATRAGGLWAAPTTGREMPRQNGKGDEIEVVELWGLVQRSERILHTVHDAVLLATETQSRLLSVIEGHPDLRRLKLRAWRGTGQQMIEMRNGGIIWYRTRTGGGARGVDEVDRIVVDEAQHAEEEHLAAVTPTQLASVNPQLNALGSAGIAGKSGWWWHLRKRALSDDPGDLGYVGHTAEDVQLDDGGRVIRNEVDPTVRTLWRRANPALVAGRVAESFFEEQFRNLGEALFAREHLGVWDAEPAVIAGGPIDPRLWDSLADTHSRIVSHDCLALAVTAGRDWASIGLSGRTSEGKLHVERLDHRPGTHWVIDRALEIWRAKRIPFRIHKSGPEAAFIALLREQGVDVVEVPTADVSQATGQLIDAVNAGELVHLGQPSLDKALRGAQLRIGQDGASVWSQRLSTVEITPLVAVTVALSGVPSPQLVPQVWSWSLATEARGGR
jgi:hypothetical protein